MSHIIADAILSMVLRRHLFNLMTFTYSIHCSVGMHKKRHLRNELLSLSTPSSDHAQVLRFFRKSWDLHTSATGKRHLAINSIQLWNSRTLECDVFSTDKWRSLELVWSGQGCTADKTFSKS